MQNIWGIRITEGRGPGALPTKLSTDHHMAGAFFLERFTKRLRDVSPGYIPLGARFASCSAVRISPDTNSEFLGRCTFHSRIGFS